MAMKYTLSVATLVFLLILSATAGSVLTSLTASSSSSNSTFEIDVDQAFGMNEYTLLEVDEGDNDEENVITERLHEFQLTASEVDGSLELTVDQSGTVESDNMECVCAPTAKDTVVNLVPKQGLIDYEGFVTVEHDGSSESCSLRNPLQECHVRVYVERTMDGAVMDQEVLFDDTFRTNELTVTFEFTALEFEPGEGLQLRLETDQVRDWHKPLTEWTMTAPL